METSIYGKMMNMEKKTILPIDSFVLALFAIVLLATIFPCRGGWAVLFEYAKTIGIFLLFFLHGAKLSRESIRNGLLNVKLQMATLLVTFVLFPVLGLVLVRIPYLEPTFIPGLCFLTFLPSTVQSSIAFTAIAKGNVPSAVCAATLSNLIGIFLTPILVAIFLHTEDSQVLHASYFAESIKKISLQLLLPFVLGHLARPRIGTWVDKHKTLLGRVDRGSILLVVYTAFSASIVDGLWNRTSLSGLIALTAICAGLLAIVFLVAWKLGIWLKLERADKIVLFFCGSKKSLATGVPIAGALFPASEIGLMILPIMIFHQIQLIACAIIAPRLTRNSEKP